jgi:alpha-glucosidase
VQAEFERILRFWLDRGVDGFRIDVGHGLFKDAKLRDEEEPFPVTPFASDWRASIDQPEVHPLYRRWRRLVEGHGDGRVLVGEVVFSDAARIAPYVRPDELHLAFSFALLPEPWDAAALRSSIDRTLDSLATVGAPATWVLENHDVTRVATRYGRRAARAATLLLLALPGTVFLYAGQELGLEEVDLPDEARQDPVFFRTSGKRKGRDGCRVPIPWERDGAGLGFTAGRPWLPMPPAWADLSVEAQTGDGASMLELVRAALSLRPEGVAPFAWRESPPGTLAFERGELVCAVNVDAPPLELAAGEPVLASEPGLSASLPAGTAAWIRGAQWAQS